MMSYHEREANVVLLPLTKEAVFVFDDIFSSEEKMYRCRLQLINAPLLLISVTVGQQFALPPETPPKTPSIKAPSPLPPPKQPTPDPPKEPTPSPKIPTPGKLGLDDWVIM